MTNKRCSPQRRRTHDSDDYATTTCTMISHLRHFCPIARYRAHSSTRNSSLSFAALIFFFFFFFFANKISTTAATPHSNESGMTLWAEGYHCRTVFLTFQLPLLLLCRLTVTSSPLTCTDADCHSVRALTWSQLGVEYLTCPRIIIL
jgi:hypothetical protein